MDNNYFRNKEHNKEHAKYVYELNKTSYNNYINNSIASTKIYTENTKFLCNRVLPYNAELSVIKCTTIEAINNNNHSDGRIAALNFASYKNPGGMFLDGSMAQEESICHNSTLYNVLIAFEDSYYKSNRKSLNKGLYLNRALYSKDIYVHDNKFCDIITCVAPNLGLVLRYNTSTPSEIQSTIYDRLDFVLHIAQNQVVDTLILGAFGCGVFKNNPETIANMFYDLLNLKYKRSFKKVIFAIPDDQNYNIFNTILGGN